VRISGSIDMRGGRGLTVAPDRILEVLDNARAFISTNKNDTLLRAMFSVKRCHDEADRAS
jgi:hypothetical protein